MSLLETRHLSKTFGGIRAVDDLDLSVDEGELRCLIGPNGAGKSTVFKLIMGLERPTAGTVHLNGVNLTALQPFQRVRRGVCMKYQTTRVFQQLTVEQNVIIACGRRGLQDGLVPWALGHFGLDRRFDQTAGEITYGEQHWLEMILTLGTAPRLVLMDEPTAGMTPEETGRTAGFFRELTERGVTLIVVEHDMSFVRKVARLVTVLHQGTLFRQGSLEDIESDREVRRIYLGEDRG